MTLLILLACSLSLVLLIRRIESRLLYPSRRNVPEVPETFGLQPEEIEFYTEDGVSLHGLWFASTEPPVASIILCHGNAGDLSSRYWMPHDLGDLPVNFFLFDYRGYGKSRGTPSERGTERDVIAAYEFVRIKQERPLPICAYGRSLGGAIALQLACQRELAGLILESTFTSILAMGQRFHPHLAPRLFCKNRYLSRDRLQNVRIPVLIAHSPDDETVPYDMGTTLADEAPLLWKFCRLSGNHEEAGWQTSPEYARAVRDYIHEVVAPPITPPA